MPVACKHSELCKEVFFSPLPWERKAFSTEIETLSTLSQEKKQYLRLWAAFQQQR